MFKKAFCYLLICSIVALTAASAAQAEIQTLPIDQSGGYPTSKDNLVGEEEYQDESIHVTTTRLNYQNTNCFVVRVKIANATQLRTAMTRDEYGADEYVSAQLMSKKKNAVLSLNGDFFKYNDSGYLVRQGQLYRDQPNGKLDVLLIDENADFYSVPTATTESVQTMVNGLEANGHKVINSFNFGPTLVENGQLCEFDNSLYQGRYKMMRVAIGQLAPLEYAVYFCYGTSDSKTGLSLANFAKMILEATPDVKIAYNLDGGGSTHVFLLQRQLHLNHSGRDICDLLYFASASDALGDREE